MNKQAQLNKFHNKTKTNSHGVTTPVKDWPKEWLEIQYKGYIRLPQIILSEPNKKIAGTFIDTLKQRSSVRRFGSKAIDEVTLSNLLFYSVGQKLNSTRRFYPSAGGRYPLETYVVLMKNINEELKQGLYHYHIKTHSLEALHLDEQAPKEMRELLNQKWSYNSHLFIINTAVFSRTINKYGVRGYRHILAETGYLGQNISLVSTLLKLGSCAIGGYIDDKINKLLDVDGDEESVVAIHTIGPCGDI